MILLEEPGKTQEKLGTRLCVWTLPFNPKVLGSLQKGGLLREEQPPLRSAALHSLHRVRNSQGHPGYSGTRSEVSALF